VDDEDDPAVSLEGDSDDISGEYAFIIYAMGTTLRPPFWMIATKTLPETALSLANTWCW